MIHGGSQLFLLGHFHPNKIGEDDFKLEPYVPGEEEPPNWLESTQVCSFLHLQKDGNTLN